jgi:hypothetical protein
MNRAVSLLCPAFAAAALVAATALPVSAAPEPTGPGGLSDSALLTVIASVGDDVFSTTDVTGLIDPSTTATQHYGPYASGSPDSGTCGNDWAEDTFNRFFTAHQNPDGSFTVVEQFKDGSFTTNAGSSPGGCETNPGGMVNAGVVGSLHGYFLIAVPAGTVMNMDSHCDAAAMSDAGCTTARFINTHFVGCAYPSPPCFVTTFFDHYVAVDQGLMFNEWKNASPDRGGNKGDIANT